MKLAVLLITVLSAPMWAQQNQTKSTITPSGWIVIDKIDPLDRHRTIAFGVEGTYLEGPAQPTLAMSKPLLTVICSDQYEGLQGGLSAGVIFDGGNLRRLPGEAANWVALSYRVDWLEQLNKAFGSKTNNLKSLTLPRRDIMDMLGWLQSKQTKTLIVGANEYLGGRIVMQFELPDRQDIAAACEAIPTSKLPAIASGAQNSIKLPWLENGLK